MTATRSFAGPPVRAAASVATDRAQVVDRTWRMHRARLPRMLPQRPTQTMTAPSEEVEAVFDVRNPRPAPAPVAKQRFLRDTPGRDSPVYALRYGLRDHFSDTLLADTAQIHRVLGDNGMPVIDAARPATLRAVEAMRDTVVGLEASNRAAWAPGPDRLDNEGIASDLLQNFHENIQEMEDHAHLTHDGALMLHTVSARAHSGRMNVFEDERPEDQTSDDWRRMGALSPNVVTRPFEIDAHQATDLLRITDLASRREILYAAGQEAPFYEFRDATELKYWLQDVARAEGGIQQLSRHFEWIDRFDRNVPHRDSLPFAQGVETVLQAFKRYARKDIQIGTPDRQDPGPANPFVDMAHRTELRIGDDLAFLRTRLTAPLNDYYERNRYAEAFARLRAQSRGTPAEATALATRLYRSVYPSQNEDLHDGVWMREQRDINGWARKVARALQTRNDYQLVTPEEIAQAGRERGGDGKVNPVALLERAGEIGTVKQLEALSDEFEKPTSNLYFIDPLKLVNEERKEPAPPLYGDDRAALAQQGRMLTDMKALTASPKTAQYQRISDEAWRMAGRAAFLHEQRLRSEGRSERMPARDVADWALKIHDGIQRGTPDRPTDWAGLFKNDSVRPSMEVFKDYRPAPRTEAALAEEVRQRQVDADQRRQLVGKIVHWVDEADQYKIPLARRYLRLTVPVLPSNGDPQQQEALINTFVKVRELPEGDLYKNISPQAFDLTDEQFRVAMARGGAVPDLKTYLDSAWTLGVEWELRQTRLAEKVQAEEVARQRDADGQRTMPVTWEMLESGSATLHDLFNEALKEAEEFVGNPVGWTGGRIMTFLERPREEIVEMKKNIERAMANVEKVASFTRRGGPVIASKNATVGILRLARNRLNQGRKLEARDVSDLANVAYNLAGTFGKTDLTRTPTYPVPLTTSAR